MDPAHTAYGADESGLICGFLFTPDAPARPLDTAAVLTWLADPGAADDPRFVWLHVNLSHVGCERWLRAHGCGSDSFFESLHEGSRSTRIEYADASLLAVINDVLFDFDFEPSEISTLWMEVTPRAVISGRRQPLRSIDRLRTSVKRGTPMRSSVELLVHLLRDQADVLIAIVRSLNAKADGIEDEVVRDRIDGQGSALGTMRRLLVRLQRLLAPEPASLFRLLQHPPAWMADADEHELRQSTEEFSLALRDVAALQERIKLLQEEIAARVNEDNNRILFILTIVTVLVLPINIVSGLLGMNVGGVPLNQHEHGFWIVFTTVAFITFIGGWLTLRRIRRRAR